MKWRGKMRDQDGTLTVEAYAGLKPKLDDCDVVELVVYFKPKPGDVAVRLAASASSRRSNTAIAYALEDLARQLKALG